LSQHESAAATSRHLFLHLRSFTIPRKAKQPFPKYTRAEGVEVKESPGRGRGVFATRNLKRGTIIENAPVILVPRAESIDAQMSFLNRYLFQTENRRACVIGLGWVSMINHSDKPNCNFFANSVMLTIKTTRGIKKGEELYIDYGWSKSDWEYLNSKK
jgi:SET domain-containing protein